MRYKPAQMTKEQKKEMFEAAFRQLMICDAFMALADFASKIEAQAKAAYRMMKGDRAPWSTLAAHVAPVFAGGDALVHLRLLGCSVGLGLRLSQNCVFKRMGAQSALWSSATTGLYLGGCSRQETSGRGVSRIPPLPNTSTAKRAGLTIRAK